MSEEIVITLTHDVNQWLGHWDGMCGGERICGGCAMLERTPTKVLEMMSANIEYFWERRDAGDKEQSRDAGSDGRDH